MTDNPAIKVLVADDSADGRAIIRRYLTELGHEIVEAENGAEAVDRFRSVRPDLVLMDIVMPVMDGLEATRQIKQMCGDRWTPLVMMSALSEEADVVAGFDAGADDYIVTPLSFRLFKARIGAITHGVRADRHRSALAQRVATTGGAIVEGLVTLDELGKVLDCNQAAQHIFGCAESDLIGCRLPIVEFELVSPTQDEFILPSFDHTHEMHGRRPDGTVFPLEIGLTALAGEERVRIIAVLRDVSERKASEARLRESMEKLSLLYHSSELGLVLCDMDGRFVQCNPSFAQMLDYLEEEILELDNWVVTPAEYTAQEIDQLSQIGRTGRFGPYEKEYIRRDGERVPVLLHGSRITGADGRQYVWCVAQDISERKRIEAEQRETALRLQRYREETEREAELAKSMIGQQLQHEALRDPRLHYAVIPAQDFSGDVVAATRSPSGRLYVMLADATGHGLAAAISVLPVLSVFYRRIAQDVALPTLVGELNDEVQRVAPTGRFVAATLICIDEDNGYGEIWIGGTPAALLIDEAGQVLERFRSRQLPLGIVPTMPLITQPEVFNWSGRTQIVLMSDGVVEAENAQGEQFGEQRILDALQAAPSMEQRFESLRAATHAHLGAHAPFDDMSTVVIDCVTVDSPTSSALAA